ncbi:LacI family DNA-binding transcriptional regulator [Pasteurellaceae bacterium USgator11]|nr:LacI family DNA-binding transcriptional regulator [Pasteurellaceae bacterium UScroc12]TNG97333.1 LacI family DNA-binding transcriptional regulator [Pasteurellaceae bacterium UScroc31]TNG98330.1 LacI family DNA-binding transcriptional regulator [Pasteurellaceae bacterium USgator41]TNH02229.1 LacI family DNA-binding transcriptional regulator [Pasteurellaceae bacterium USgator11]
MSSNSQAPRTRRTTGRVTLADVAKRVGVGQMTVSRALRTPELVSDNLREKIESAVQQLGYIPNAAARELASVSSRNIVIITSSITSTENTLILSALQKKLKPLDVQLVILLAGEKKWLPELINHSPLAIVLLNLKCPPQEAEWIKQSGVLTIEIGAKQVSPLGINVGIDSKQAMQTMIHYLVERGCQQIGLLSAKQDSAIFQQYLESWHTTLLAKYLDPHLILHCAEEISFSVGAKLFNDAMLMWGRIDALVFLSDELACGALCEAQRKRINIPYETLIVGLGGLDVGSVSYPRLTTIDIPYEHIGETAGQQLVELLQQNRTFNETLFIPLPVKLLKRDSA